VRLSSCTCSSDGRRAFRVIAGDLDVSEGTIRTSVRKLELSSWHEVSYVSSVLGPYDLSVQAMASAVAERRIGIRDGEDG
jgi:hypothetical protein